MRLPDKIDIAIMSGLLGLASLAVFLVIANVDLPEREVEVVVFVDGVYLKMTDAEMVEHMRKTSATSYVVTTLR